MATYYKVPEQFGGLSISDLRQRRGEPFGQEQLAQMLGIGVNQPFQAGQSLGFNPLPGMTNSAEEQFIKQFFQPGVSPEEEKAAAFQEQERGRLGEFTNRLQQVPAELEAIRQEMGIPQAFETFGTLGETARGAAQRVEDLPEAIRLATQGKDVSANQLGRITSARQQEALPGLRDVGRALESSQGGLENLLSEFTSRTQAAFAPFELEAGLLGQNIAQEFDLFKTNISASLERELEQLRQTGATDRANIERAMKLAELEQTADNVTFEDLGDRIGIFDKVGNLLRTEKKGKLGTLGNDGW